jgi:hypothetical protein
VKTLLTLGILALAIAATTISGNAECVSGDFGNYYGVSGGHSGRRPQACCGARGPVRSQTQADTPSNAGGPGPPREGGALGGDRPLLQRLAFDHFAALTLLW